MSQQMRQILFFSAFSLLFTANALAQSNYPGKLGYAVSPEGHPHNFTLLGEFQQEVVDMCMGNGGVVFANGPWRDNAAASGKIPVGLWVSMASPKVKWDIRVFSNTQYPNILMPLIVSPENRYARQN